MDFARVKIQYANGSVEDRWVPPGTHQVGREAGEIILGDPNVSGSHAVLEVSASGILVTDSGSRNGTFDHLGRRIGARHPLGIGEFVRMGNSTLTLMEGIPGGRTVAMQVPEMPPPVGGASATPSGSGPCSGYSHPDRAVRHSYPVVQGGFGVSDALALVAKTAPFVAARLGILFAKTVTTLIYWAVVLSIAGFLFARVPALGWAWLLASFGVAGWFWHTVVRYFLYLLKSAHIAVLTELLMYGRVGNGSEGMLAYGRRVVTERFGQVNALFAMDMLVRGVVKAFNRTLDLVSSVLPIPGLDSVFGIAKGILAASTTYIDETIFSYNLARGDANAFRCSKDGLIYYAQNTAEILKTGAWVVVLDKVFSFALLLLVLLPTIVVISILPNGTSAWIPWTMVIAAVLFSRDLQQALLRPVFLTLVMLKFHSVVRGQAIDLVWDRRLDAASEKFAELKARASDAVNGREPAANRAVVA